MDVEICTLLKIRREKKYWPLKLLVIRSIKKREISFIPFMIGDILLDNTVKLIGADSSIKEIYTRYDRIKLYKTCSILRPSQYCKKGTDVCFR